MRKPRMSWWKAALVNLMALGAVVGYTVLTLQQWLERREEIRWPIVAATIVGYEQGPGFKGLPFTRLLGRYTSVAGTTDFSVIWGPSDLSRGEQGRSAWIPPRGVPPVGSAVRVHADPHRPSVVALEEGPRVVTTLGTFGSIAFVDLTLIAVSIAVWLIRP